MNHNGGKGGGHSKKERPICTYYGLTSHIANKCYKPHGYPPGYKPKGGNKAMANQVTGNFGNFDALTALTNSQVNGTLPPICFQPDVTSTTPNVFGSFFWSCSFTANSTAFFSLMSNYSSLVWAIA